MMYFTALLLSCIFLTNATSLTKLKPKFPHGKIVGGSSANIEDVPWQVSLEDGGFLFCGGSIISANYILTAAQCVHQSTIYNILVRVGTSRLLSEGALYEVDSFVENPEFSPQSLDNDVAVIKLAYPIEFSNKASPIVLRLTEASVGETAEVAGFGTTKPVPSSRSISLKKVSVPLVSREDCNAAYNGTITDGMICAGEEGLDACNGDTGGALTVNGQQVGIVSWSKGCALSGYPKVYANVAAYKHFIDNNSDSETVWV